MRFPGFTDEWVKTTFGEITTKVGSGVTPRGGESVYKTEGHPFVRSQNVGMGCLLLDDVAYIDDLTHNRQKSTELKKGDVLLNITGASIGRSAIVDDRITCGNVNQHVCIIRLKDGYAPKFSCSYILSNFGQRQIDSFQCGGNRQGLNFEQIRSMTINLPSFAEQKKLSRLLEAIDQRIATQNKIIEDLKKLKSAIIEMSFGTIAEETPLAEVLIQISERAKKGVDLPVLSVNNALGFINQSEQFESREVASADTSNYKIVREGVIAYNPARINVGSVACCNKGIDGIVSPMYVCFKTNELAIPQYVFLFLRSHRFQIEMEKRLEGSVRQCLTFDGLCNIAIPLPTISEQQSIFYRLKAVDGKISLETTALHLLQKQRQYLLQQMFI